MVIVTGGCGFLGSHVVARLVAEDRDVLILDNGSAPRGGSPFPYRVSGARFLPVDLSQLATVEQLVALVDSNIRDGLDEIWHLASPASPRHYKGRPIETLRLGGHALDILLQLSLRTGAKLLYASSSEVYGNPFVVPTPETEPSRIYPVGPRSMYDAAKVYGEALCAAYVEQYRADVRIARIFNSYGPNCYPEDGRVVPALLSALLNDHSFALHGAGSQTRSFCYVDDTVAGLFHVMNQWTSHLPVNVGGEEEVTIWQLAKLAERVTGRSLHYEISEPQDQHDPLRRLPDTSLLRGLGWAPSVELEEGLRRTWEWLRSLQR